VLASYDLPTLEKVFRNTDEHDRNGSYDGTFGVTCAFLWLRGVFLGIEAPETKKTYAWVKEILHDFDDREKILAYCTFYRLGLATEHDMQDLRKLLLSYQTKELSEVDILVYLRAANLIQLYEIIMPLTLQLEQRQENGYWIDLATSASVAVTLVEALNVLEQKGKLNEETKSKIIAMLFNVIIYIQIAMDNPQHEKYNYLWENKASTTIKCIHAWLKFEQLIDLPIYEVIDSLKSYSQASAALSGDKTSLAVLEDIKQESYTLKLENIEMSKTIEQMNEVYVSSKKKLKWNRLLTGYLLISFYIIGSFLFVNQGKLTSLFQTVFLDNFEKHIQILTLIFTVLGVSWIQNWRKNRTQ
jgi:hypothetical protein